MPGRVGFVSRSGTLVYQIVHELTQRGIGQSTCIGMGGDPVHGIGFIGSLAMLEADDGTDLMIMIGEIGGDDEERAAAYIAEHVREAGRGLHRRVRGAAGQTDGARGGHRHGLQGHRGRQGGGPGGQRRARGADPDAGGGAGPGRSGMIRAVGRAPARPDRVGRDRARADRRRC